jgi:transcription elongation GreA/GreB family factor
MVTEQLAAGRWESGTVEAVRWWLREDFEGVMGELSELEAWLEHTETLDAVLEEWELDALAVSAVKAVRRVRELREALTGEEGLAWQRVAGVVAVGDEVVLEVSSEETRFKLGSYLVPAERARDGWVSYRTQLASLVLGARVGETTSGRVAGRDVLVTVVSSRKAS